MESKWICRRQGLPRERKKNMCNTDLGRERQTRDNKEMKNETEGGKREG